MTNKPVQNSASRKAANSVNSNASQQAANSTAHQNKPVRKVAASVFGRIENDFNSIMKECMELEQRKLALAKEIKERRKVVSTDAKTGQATYAPLTRFEIALRRKELEETKVELKRNNRKLNNIGLRLSSASKQTAKAAKQQSARLSEQVRLSKMAVKQIDNIKAAVGTYFDRLQRTDAPLFNNLRQLALSDGGRFFTEFQRALRAATLSPEMKAQIKASAPVRTALAKMAREAFGWSDNRK